MAFHEIRFPVALSFGATGGPERRTEIVEFASGFEERSSPWAQSRRRYDAGAGLHDLDDLAGLLAFFEARAGRLHGFRWKDWADCRSGPPNAAPTAFDQILGLGDGSRTEFALVKRYSSGGQGHERPITKPVAGTVLVALSGDEQQEGVDFTLDPATGIVSFAVPPAPGAEITAGFEFDTPVRFDTDHLQISVASFRAGHLPEVPLVEVRL